MGKISAATSAAVTESKENNRRDVDKLASELEIDAAVLAGIKALKGWNSGKQITQTELEDAKMAFMKNPC